MSRNDINVGIRLVNGELIEVIYPDRVMCDSRGGYRNSRTFNINTVEILSKRERALHL